MVKDSRQKRPDRLLGLVESFFNNHLRQVRGASPHTLRAYGHGLRLFFLHVAEKLGRPVSHLTLDNIQADRVLDFLSYIESRRDNRASTRNCRLAAIRSFAEHLLRHDFDRAEQYRKILAIPSKRSTRRPATYLEPEEMQILLKQIEIYGQAGSRDRALILFLYNSGARISEALAVRWRDLHLDRPRQVRLFGKGTKERFCPLWGETADLLRKLAGPQAHPDQVLFLNQLGQPLSRDGAAYIISKYVRRAAEVMPLLRKRKITPHVFRHSCAVALLQAGIDLTVIRDYLGHVSAATTGHYVTSNLQMKRKAIMAFWKRARLEPSSSSSWKPSADLLAFLESL